MRKFAGLCLITMLWLTALPRAASAANVDLTPIADTTVKQSGSDQSFGSEPSLDMLYDSGADPATVPQDTQESYLKFDLSAIPKGMYIVSAKLILHGYGTSLFGYGDIRVRQITGAWSEATTWTNRPSYSPSSEANMEVLNNNFPSADVTNLVSRWQQGQATNYGIALRAFGDADYRSGLYQIEDAHASSKEGPNPAHLLITYSATPPSPPSGGNTGSGHTSTGNSTPGNTPTDTNETSTFPNAGTAPNSPGRDSGVSDSGTLFSRISSGVQSSPPPGSGKLNSKLKSTPTTSVKAVLHAAKVVVVGNKPISLWLWLGMVLGLVTLLVLGTWSVKRGQKIFFAVLSLPGLIAYLQRKKLNRGTWGRVMSSLTMRSIPRAMVSLYNAKTKALVDRTFSDDRGLYGFFVDPGEYTLTVSHSAHTFPPILMPFAYQGEAKKLESLNGILHLDLVMDPGALTSKQWQKIESFIFYVEALRLPLMIIGFVVTGIALVVYPTLLGVVVFGWFIFLAILEIRHRHEGHYLLEFKHQNDEVVNFAHATIKTQHGRVMLSKVINQDGKLFLALPAGNYILETTTFPIPGRPAIKHFNQHLEITPTYRVKIKKITL